MACMPCWQQRQLFMMAWRQGNPFVIAQVMRDSIAITTDKIRGIDVNSKYAALSQQRPMSVWRQPRA